MIPGSAFCPQLSFPPPLHCSCSASRPRCTKAAPTFQQGRGPAGYRLTWAPPTVPCSRNRHMSPGKCGTERVGGCTGETVDPARGCSNPDTLSSRSRRRRVPEFTAERPPVPPGTPAAEPADGPLSTAAAIFPWALELAWRDDANTPRRTPRGEGREEGALVLRFAVRSPAGREHARRGRAGATQLWVFSSRGVKAWSVGWVEGGRPDQWRLKNTWSGLQAPESKS